MLIQAAQAVRAHPGPLGYFFRRMKQRKCHNVAVVAVAHKLALLAWHLLKTGEPYRYALPRATQDKLAKLRTAATGQKRRGGVGKGVDPRKTRASGQKGIMQRSLPEVYVNEQIPAATPAPAGEQRHIAELKLEEFVDGLQKPQVTPRRAKKKGTAESD
jgi:hypothetical protein